MSSKNIIFQETATDLGISFKDNQVGPFKKSLYIVITLFFISIGIAAQEYSYVPFPDSGAVWSEEYLKPFDPPIYERFALPGDDTIINDLNYNKLYIFHDTAFNKENAKYIGGIREDENKCIYFYGDFAIHELKPVLYQKEILLYNFDLKIGDTLKEGNFFDGWIIVENIDTIKIKDTYRKKISFDPMPWVEWIEGIGSNMGLLFTSGDLPISGPSGSLICFEHFDELLYYDERFSDCFPITTSNDNVRQYNQQIKVYPNPVIRGQLIFDFRRKEIKNIDIYNSTGKLISYNNISYQSKFLLVTEKYQPGIYLYKITDKNGIVNTGKFVIR